MRGFCYFSQFLNLFKFNLMIADSYFQVMIGDVVTDVHIIAIRYGKVFYALKPLGFEEKITPELMTQEEFKIHYWNKGFNFANKNGAFSLKKKSLSSSVKQIE